MKSVEQALISFFEQAAKKDKSQLKKIKYEERFTVKKERWYFTLPDLFSYLQQQGTINSSIDYKQFRQLIFSSPINKTVKTYGAEITVLENKGKVDESVYALVWNN